jgi:hypothetical protein
MNAKLMISAPWVNLLPKKATWVTFNRLLAWALLLWPVAAIALHPVWPIGLVQSLAYELVLLVAHAVLSLLIFGLPMPVARKWLVWFWGVVPLGSKQRATFLINSWAVAVSWLQWVGLFVIWPALDAGYTWLGLKATAAGGLLIVWWVVFVIAVSLRIPFATVMHVGEALTSFFVRQRWMKERLASDLAFVMACFYVSAAIVHVFVLGIGRHS